MERPRRPCPEPALQSCSSLSPVLPPSILVLGCWSQEHLLISFLHADLPGACFPGSPACGRGSENRDSVNVSATGSNGDVALGELSR